MIVAGMMRCKNEARWIKRSIESIAPLCNAGIVVLDDHSTDGTAEIALGLSGRVKAAVIPSPFRGLDEVRDKNALLDMALKTKADWVVCIDGDEVLMPGHADRLKIEMQRIMENGAAIRALAFSILYLWDREDQIRVDGVYGSMSRVSAFRPGKERFEPTGGVNFHCGNCPQAIQGRAHAGVSLLHYGYMERDDRLRKYSWYNAKDPHNFSENEYRHIVQGDIVEIPADAVLKHGGPLRLRQL